MIKSCIVFVGGAGGSNIGMSFFKAAQKLGQSCFFVDHYEADQACWPMRFLNRHFYDRRPANLTMFSKKILRICGEHRPSLLVTTGMSPVREEELIKIKKQDIKCVNYLTDDPWNLAHRCDWFLSALAKYNYVFSVRRSNIADIVSLQGPRVVYLPFGYDAELFYPEELSVALNEKYKSDVVFVGGADADRAPYIKSLIKVGIKVSICGSYWGRYKINEAILHGQVGIQEVRRVTRAAKIALCLVRRANRDDNCMRSFEIPAIGACMLAEDTLCHREVFGEEAEAVLYFKTPREMLDKVRFLLSNQKERMRLASAAHVLITQGRHTYQDRLEQMLTLGQE